MKRAGFAMNGKSKIYARSGSSITCDITSAIGLDTDISEQERKRDIRFYGNDLMKGNFVFRHFILKPDMMAGLRQYNDSIKKRQSAGVAKEPVIK